ncbi:MAG TPA: GNAT family protein [Roseiflexaceae bacterium]|nr:GNAT family protein [Roseiflexaceae bacterium]
MANDRWNPRPLAKYERDFEKRLEEDEPTWFVVEVEGQILGTVGLHALNRFAGTAALDITLYDRERLGKGYGPEAIRLLLDWAFRMQNWRRIWLEVMSSDERAIRAYRASGFVEKGRLQAHDFYDGGYVDVTVMGLLREEWQRQREI